MNATPIIDAETCETRNAMCYNHTGYTHDELTRAFDAVKDPDNWKFPIRTELTMDEMEDMKIDVNMIYKAVEYFAGGDCVIYAMWAETFRFVAPGYYAKIGA